MPEFSFIYITTGNVDEAETIGKSLVEKRLAACANVIHPMSSFYWWDGKVQEDQECVLIAKSRRDLIPSLIEAVRSQHSYDCPCIVELPILNGNPDYLKWLAEETKA